MATFAEYIGPERIKARGFWKKDKRLNRENILLWAKWFENKLCITEPKGWYTITGKQINENGGSGFFTAKAENGLGESVVALAKFLYPEIQWKAYLFSQPPQRHWKSIENRREWFHDFCTEHGLETEDKYYMITSSMLESSSIGSGPFHSYYEYSIVNMLRDLFPHREWFPWRLEGQVPKNYWKSRENIEYWFKKEILEPNGVYTESGEVNYTTLYSLTATKIHDAHGRGLLVHIFNGSLLELLKYLYPGHNWQFWKFVSAPNGAWKLRENILKYLTEEHGVTVPQALYDFMISDMPSSLLCEFKTMVSLCRFVYPDLTWDVVRFRTAGYSRAACRFLDCLSRANDILIQHALNGGEFSIPNTRFKADGYLEYNNKKFIFEYHGCYYHGCRDCYPDGTGLSKNGRSHSANYQRTSERTRILQELGYTVIEIWECKVNLYDLKMWWQRVSCPA